MLERRDMNKNRPQILAIDDTLANLLTLGMALASSFDLQVATSGAMGLVLALESPPDLILLDVMMPEMDGFETCRRLKNDPRTLHIPVVMITALDQTDERVRGLDAGADDFLTKPVDFTTLLARARSLVRLKRLLDEVGSARADAIWAAAEVLECGMHLGIRSFLQQLGQHQHDHAFVLGCGNQWLIPNAIQPGCGLPSTQCMRQPVPGCFCHRGGCIPNVRS